VIDSPAQPPSRREKNKAATRTAILEAALGQLETAGYAALTAESVADAAGISRRTFFNYFPSIEAALNEPTRLLLENSVAVLDELDPEIDLLSAAVTTVESLVDPALLEPIANLYLHASVHPQMARMQLEAWNDCAEALTEIVAARAPQGTPLAASVFAHSVIGAGKAAFAAWARELGEHPDPTDPRRTQMLRTILAEAVAQLRDGFPSLQQRAPHTRKG
jgi:AcrR family transcriptional regulator